MPRCATSCLPGQAFARVAMAWGQRAGSVRKPSLQDAPDNRTALWRARCDAGAGNARTLGRASAQLCKGLATTQVTRFVYLEDPQWYAGESLLVAAARNILDARQRGRPRGAVCGGWPVHPCCAGGGVRMASPGNNLPAPRAGLAHEECPAMQLGQCVHRGCVFWNTDPRYEPRTATHHYCTLHARGAKPHNAAAPHAETDCRLQPSVRQCDTPGLTCAARPPQHAISDIVYPACTPEPRSSPCVQR